MQREEGEMGVRNTKKEIGRWDGCGRIGFDERKGKERREKMRSTLFVV